MSKNAHVDEQAADQQLLAGVEKRLMARPTFTVGGKAVKPADITSAIQSRLDARTAVLPAEAAFHKAVADAHAVLTGSHQFMVDLRDALHVEFARDAVALGDFGLKPRTRRAPKVKVKAAAADQAQATRKARGTKGSRQREAIKAEPPAQPQPPTPQGGKQQ